MSWLNRISSVLILLDSFLATAQVDNPYHVNGDAFQENCNCYTLTPDAFFQSGSVWNINKISLNEPFDYKFNVYLGCYDGDGADGIAFVLQPVSTNIGAAGGGIGYDGITPSIGVLVDTWQNYEDNDPAYDHIAIHKNGIIDHSPSTDLAEPVTALSAGGNIEDCEWHTLRISWEPSTKLLKTQFDGVDRVQAVVDLVSDIFNGDDLVFWGFTGATGGSKNIQKICTSLNAGFSLPANQTTCFQEPITFVDSSSSFGSIEKWFWDFGDGSTFGESNPPPHVYSSPGIYEVKLSILGNNGCVSDTFTSRIVMGTKPVVRYSYPTPICEGTAVSFIDSSYVEFGTITEWHWTINGVSYTGQSPPAFQVSGDNDVSLQVKTAEGCVSDIASGVVTAFPKPEVDFVASDICYGEPSVFIGENLNAVPVDQWVWSFGNGAGRMNVSPQESYVYPNGGEYTVQLTGISSDGCSSQTVSNTLKVHETHAFAGNDTVVAIGQPVALSAAGGETYKWTPSAGLSADNIPNPIAILREDAEFVLTASTAGCSTTDTIRFKVYKGPDLYVPSAFSPNNDGINDTFRFIAVGIKSVDLFRVYNRYGQLIFSSTQVMTGWDGKVNGFTQPSGSYVWMIKGTDFNGSPHYKKGTVTLVR